MKVLADRRNDGEILRFTFELLDLGCSLPVAKYWILVAGCLILDVWIEDWLLKIVTKDILDL